MAIKSLNQPFKMKRNFKYFLPAVCLLLLLAACEKNDVTPEFTPSRLFMPGDISIAGSETQVTITWNPSLFTEGKNVQYTVEVSQDTLFQTPALFSEVVDTSKIIITDEKLQLKQKYFARIKANGQNGSADSKWITTKSFSVNGEQLFIPVSDASIKDKSVLLKWRNTADVTKIVLTPDGGTPIDVSLEPADITASEKLIKGLQPSTNYTAGIYTNARLRGTVSFRTKEPSIFTYTITPAENLIEVVANAANGDVIGLEPGVYDASANNIHIVGKTITLQSVSGDPANTKVNFKEVKLSGTGAGVTLRGIEFDGSVAKADYFLNLTGLNSDAEAAEFTSILVENSIVHHTNNAFMRGNRGGNNAHKINSIKVNNTVAYANGTGSYHYFMLDKLEFKTLEITNSTMYDIARAFISWATNITVPTPPTILIDQSTINNFGFSGVSRNNIILDANANMVNFTFRNSIIANTPKPGQEVGTSAMRANAGSTILFQNNNYFKLMGGNPVAPLTFPAYVQMLSNQTIDLGWDATTTNFTLPADSPLRTASTSGGPIGDPRWF